MDKERKNELKQLNYSAWFGETKQVGALDTSLKKNTAFVKKLKTCLTKDSQAAIIKEINALSLTKYVTELVTSTEEGLLKVTKPADIVAAAEIISAIHQRFSEAYTLPLISWFLYQFENPKAGSGSASGSASGPAADKEEKDRITKNKFLLRVFTDLCAVNVIIPDVYNRIDLPNYCYRRNPEGKDHLLVVVLKEILSYDVKSGTTLPIAVNFLKKYPQYLTSGNDEGFDLGKIFSIYTDSIISISKDLNTRLNNLIIKKNKAQIRTGKTLEEYEESYEFLNNKFENFKSSIEAICPIMNMEAPTLKVEIKSNNTTIDSIIVTKDSNVWLNEEERKFYEDFPEIPEAVEHASEGVVEQSNRGGEITEFLIDLDNAQTAEECDSLVLKFWNNKYYNKATKNRLFKHFIMNNEVSKTKVYARFLKSNEPIFNELIQELISYLDQGFRSQIHHNGLNFKNIMFFCELIKFKLIPEHLIFHKIRSLILNLKTQNNVEILGIFFETCGKFLLNNFNQLMEEMLELLNEKKKDHKLSMNVKLQIVNLFLILKPPNIQELKKIKREKPAEEVFLKRIFRKDLNIKNYTVVKKYIRSIEFNDESVLPILINIFTKPEKLNFENIKCLAEILTSCPVFFKNMVIDSMIEKIIRNMEINDYRYNRIRISHCKYIAEIFEQKIINFNLVHELLYKILTYGHKNNNPLPGELTELDLPDNYFRINLICTILLNITRVKNSFKFKLVVFMKYFDYYIYLKDSPVPKNFEFEIVKVFEKFQVERSGDLNEAIKSLNDISVKQKLRSLKNGTGAAEEEEEEEETQADEYQEEEEDDDLDEEDEDEEEEEDEDEEDEEEEEEEEEDDDEEEEEEDEEDEDEEDEEEAETKLSKETYEMYEKKLLEQEEKKIEADIEREFRKLVSDSLSSSQRNNPTKALSINLPSNEGVSNGSTGTAPAAKPKMLLKPGNKIAFKFLTKDGGVKDVELSKDNKFANQVITNEEERIKQDERIKKYILQANFEA